MIRVKFYFDGIIENVDILFPAIPRKGDCVYLEDFLLEGNEDHDDIKEDLFITSEILFVEAINWRNDSKGVYCQIDLEGK